MSFTICGFQRSQRYYKVEVNELTPSQVRAEAEKYAHKEVASQMAQFRELGVMADWSPETTYRTLGWFAGHPIRYTCVEQFVHRSGLRIATT